MKTIPLINIVNQHITATQITDFDNALDTLIGIVQSLTNNLADEEHTRHESINERNKLFGDKLKAYEFLEELKEKVIKM